MSAAPPAGADAPLDDMTLYELRQILFGDDPNELDVDRWHRQGFVFAGTNAAAPWGLAQVSGGPCGILAPVQAWVINDLLFDRPPALAPVQPSAVAVLPALDVSAGRCQEALVAALVRILISARDAATAPEAYQLVYYRAVQAGAEASGEAEQAPAMQPWLCTIVGSDALHAFVQRVISSFHGPAGVLHFLYSVLLTRGLDRVRQDMDDPRAPLVGQFGHCGQELVNLMITGRAVTNVFDGDKLLGDAADPEAFRLKGVERHFHVGFLTLLEVLRYAKVGMHYKAPLHPIWVIGSDSHYTVAFGDRACIGRLSAAEAATHAAKVAFQQLDPEENGFISADRLADLQRQLAALQNVPIAQLRRELDDGGIVMWERVKTFLLNPPAPSQSGASAALPAVAWSCGACTFQNGPHASACEICESARPVQAAPTLVPVASGAGAAPAAAGAAADESPEHFQIFHFNGIGMQVRRISVVQVDANMAEADAGIDRGVKEVLLTRWPEALIEYLDGAPSMN